jgi:hypothetical protein
MRYKPIVSVDFFANSFFTQPLYAASRCEGKIAYETSVALSGGRKMRRRKEAV